MFLSSGKLSDNNRQHSQFSEKADKWTPSRLTFEIVVKIARLGVHFGFAHVQLIGQKEWFIRESWSSLVAECCWLLWSCSSFAG